MTDPTAAVLAKIAAARGRVATAGVDAGATPAPVESPIDQFKKDVRLVFAMLRRGFLSPDEAQCEFDRTILTVQESLGDEKKMAEHFAHWRARAAEVERDIARSDRIKAEVRAERAGRRKAA